MRTNNLLNLCRFMAEMNPADIPLHVMEHAKLVLLDTLGVMLAGSKTAEAKRTSQQLSANFLAHQGATCIGKSEASDPLNAALINGIAGSTLEYEQSRPENNPAKVTIRLKDGMTFSHEIINCLGDPRNPLPKKDICGKCMTLAAPLIGQNRSDTFLNRVMEIEHEDDIRPLMALLRSNSD